MLSEKAKEVFGKLVTDKNMPYPAVAIRFHVVRPKNVPQYEGEKMAFCQFLSEAQKGKHFYMSKENDACYGKVAMGMEPKPPVTAFGQAGEDFEMFRTNSSNRKIYQELPVIEPGTVNYVEYAPVSECDFNPDLIFCVANQEAADVLLHATSYTTGDFWESKSTPVLSCAWMYAYPVISGKVNYVTTGFYHGLRRRKIYPAGLTMISIPYNKIDAVVTALDEMPWTAIAFREDEESKKELKRRMDHWQEMAAELNSHVDLR